MDIRAFLGSPETEIGKGSAPAFWCLFQTATVKQLMFMITISEIHLLYTNKMITVTEE